MGAGATHREQVLQGALDWIRAHLEWFGPAQWDQHLPPREIPTQTVLELLLLVRVLERGPRAEATGDLADRTRALALEQVGAPWFAAGLDRVDGYLGYYIWVLSLLADQTDPRLAPRRAEVDRILRAYGAGVRPLEWPVVNRIELDYIVRTGGFTLPADGFAELRGDAAYRSRSPLLVGEPEAYAITHELLYAADLGLEPLPAPTAYADTAALLRQLLATHLVAGQLDLSAELLHCLLFVPDPTADPLVVAGWTQLAAGQLASGAVPGPPYDPQLEDEPDPDKRTAMIFRTCYHTTVVVALAAAAAELPGMRRPDPDQPTGEQPTADPLWPGRVAAAVAEDDLERAVDLARAHRADPDAARVVADLTRLLEARGATDRVAALAADPAR